MVSLFSIFFTCFSHYSDFIFTPPSCQTMALPTYGHPIKTGQKITTTRPWLEAWVSSRLMSLGRRYWYMNPDIIGICKFQLEFNLTKSACIMFSMFIVSAWFLTFFGINKWYILTKLVSELWHCGGPCCDVRWPWLPPGSTVFGILLDWLDTGAANWRVWGRPLGLGAKMGCKIQNL